MLRARVRRARSELARPAGCLPGNRAGKAATEVPPRTRGEGQRAGRYFIYHSPPWSVTAVRSAIPLLENGPSAPVEEALRYRFSNRHPQTETLGSGLEYRVNKPVPLALIGTGWKNQPVPLRLPRWRKRAASLVPVGISNRYQRVFLFILIFFICFLYSLRIAMCTRSSYTVLYIYVHQSC